MKVLSWAIVGYIMGLLVFYTCAVFNTYAWDLTYFGWSKLFDCGLMFWWALYLILPEERKVLKWLMWFARIRFLWDVQSFFSGIEVNNSLWTAILFLLLLSITAYLCLRPEGKAAKFLSKHLKI